MIVPHINLRYNFKGRSSKSMERNTGQVGRFVNPDNRAFQVALNSKIYVDKTGILEYTNSVLDTNQALICNSRPGGSENR